MNVVLNAKNEPEIINFSQSHIQEEDDETLEKLSKNDICPPNLKFQKACTYKKDWFSYGRILMLVMGQIENLTETFTENLMNLKI